MIKCGKSCIPCCDHCVHAIHDGWEKDGHLFLGGPVGCLLHSDKKHQEIAVCCGYCEDFHCVSAKEVNKHHDSG